MSGRAVRAVDLPAGGPREVLLVGLSALGDVVRMLPLATAIKRKYPELRLIWLTQPGPRRLLTNHPAIDEFILFDRRTGLAGLRSFLEARKKLRGRRFDLVLDAQVALKAGILTAFADAPVKLGYDRRRASDLNWLFTTHRIPTGPRRHVLDEYFEFLEWLDIPARPLDWGLDVTEEERWQQTELLAPLRADAPICAIVVGTSRRRKNWRADRYVRLVDAIGREYGLGVVLVGGPSAEERRIAGRVLAESRVRPLNAVGDGVRRLVWLLNGCDLVVSPDTGPLHIARALDTPVVGLYGYTNPKRFGPYGKYQDLVVDGYARYPGEPYPCSNEYRAGGMDRVTVGAVLKKVERALQRYVRPRRPAVRRAH